LLSTFLDSATAFVLPATLLASGVSAVIVAAGWRRRNELLRRQGRPLVAEPIELGQTTFAAGVLDVGSETTAVMRQFEHLAAQRLVALELAVQPDLVVHTDSRALRQILGDVVSRAIEQSPCGRVLLAAAHVGGRVQIAVSDDGPHPDRALQASRLRPAESLAALQGATMDIDVRAGQGTTVVLRLPAAATSRRPGIEAETLDPASTWASAERERERSAAGR
jgi:hypothetical protein